MSYCITKGKDKIIFATEEYLTAPSKIELKPDDPKELDTSNQGAILPNGEINWDCPCLGNMPNGPCGPSFRQSFQCWVNNKGDDKSFAEKCYGLFVEWEKCLSVHKKIYRPDESSSKTEEASTQPTAASTSAKEVD